MKNNRNVIRLRKMVTTFSYFSWEILIPEKWYPPCANPAPKGAGAHAMPPYYLYGTLPTRIVFPNRN